jgi:hypothetical protein
LEAVRKLGLEADNCLHGFRTIRGVFMHCFKLFIEFRIAAATQKESLEVAEGAKSTTR